jgi:hypothetical protein
MNFFYIFESLWFLEVHIIFTKKFHLKFFHIVQNNDI